MWELLLDCLLDSLKDCALMLPILFLAYLLMEFIEQRAGEKLNRVVAKVGVAGPALGGLLGAVPQCGFSGAIASVVCGITFAALRSRFCKDDDSEKVERFGSFWETLDVLMNSVLYILLGLSFTRILQMEHVVILSLVAIAANFIARAGSLSISTLIMGKIPDGYDKLNFIKLLTWGGLRGGLSVALAMSTKEMLPEQTYFIILGGTYAIVFFTTVIQGLTMKPVYSAIDRSVQKKNGRE